jgi:hypothetical protein
LSQHWRFSSGLLFVILSEAKNLAAARPKSEILRRGFAASQNDSHENPFRRSQ